MNLADPADAGAGGESSGPENLRIVFFGTPDFAVPSLERLAGDPGFRVEAVVSQPDRAVGRHASVSAPAVARVARDRGIPLLQPAGIRSEEFAATIRDLAPDALVVVAYGKLLPPRLLAVSPLGAINVHGSLLPRHRGASPVQAAILAGDAVTGVATMRMTEGLDEGPVFAARETAIEAFDTAQTLSARLAALGAELLAETLRGLANGTLSSKPQEGEPSYCRPIRREDALVDWERPAAEILRRLRAFTPWPGLFTFLEGERVKILDADESRERPAAPSGSFDLASGELVASAGEGTAVRIQRLQRAGRKPVTGAEFARAARLPGRFGAPR